VSERAVKFGRLIITLGLAAFIAVALITAEAPERDRALAIGSVIRCPVCQGEPIAESPSGLARDMMDLVRLRIAEGHSDEQIIDELLTSYSGSQLLDPPIRPATVALWAVPGISLIVGIGVLLTSRRDRQEITR